MGFIQNISLQNVRDGFHYDAGSNSMLIQIVDPGHDFPTPRYQFAETHQFEFLDVERGDILDEFGITEEQAEQIASLLRRAVERRMNVIVHCHAGLCRSGAVAQAGIAIGLLDTETDRTPNQLVRELLNRNLGINQY